MYDELFHSLGYLVPRILVKIEAVDYNGCEERLWGTCGLMALGFTTKLVPDT